MVVSARGCELGCEYQVLGQVSVSTWPCSLQRTARGYVPPPDTPASQSLELTTGVKGMVGQGMRDATAWFSLSVYLAMERNTNRSVGSGASSATSQLSARPPVAMAGSINSPKSPPSLGPLTRGQARLCPSALPPESAPLSRPLTGCVGQFPRLWMRLLCSVPLPSCPEL